MKTCQLVLLLALSACSSARVSQREIDDSFRRGKYEDAIKDLEAGLKKEGEGVDQLLYLLDLALVQHTAGHYEESTKGFLEADKIADLKDYTSISNEAAAFLAGDNIKNYKGEDFENVLISTYLAMDYAVRGMFEDAIVEAKRVNRKLHLLVTDGQRNYKQNAFARYLSGILYEAGHEYDSAYLDYKESYKLRPEYKEVGKDLWRLAWILRRPEDMEKWKKEFSLGDSDFEQARLLGERSKHSELIVLFENGIGPEKRPHPNFTKIPKFYPRYNPVEQAEVWLDEKLIGKTTVLDDIEATAIENLDEKYAGIIAKKVGSVVVKEVIADQVARQTDSPLLGIFTSLALHSMDQADLRSWKLLPKNLQIIRIPLPAGKHKIQIRPIGVTEVLPEQETEILEGQKKFMTFRYIPP